MFPNIFRMQDIGMEVLVLYLERIFKDYLTDWMLEKNPKMQKHRRIQSRNDPGTPPGSASSRCRIVFQSQRRLLRAFAGWDRSIFKGRNFSGWLHSFSKQNFHFYILTPWNLCLFQNSGIVFAQNSVSGPHFSLSFP